MTRQEAVFYIKELQKTYASMDKKVAKALDIAIKALKANVLIGDYVEATTLMEKKRGGDSDE